MNRFRPRFETVRGYLLTRRVPVVFVIDVVVNYIVTMVIVYFIRVGSWAGGWVGV